MSSDYKVRASARRQARRKALQALYQCYVAGTSTPDIKKQYLGELNPKKVDIEYFTELVDKVSVQADALDKQLEVYLDRTISDLNPIELIVLRMGTYEFEHRIDVPYKVVINEALILSKIFGATDGHKYVNGVLDKLASALRPHEFNAEHHKSGE